MAKFKTKIIKQHGVHTDPNLHEINELGLKGWKLDKVSRECRINADVYTYSKPKWWALF